MRNKTTLLFTSLLIACAAFTFSVAPQPAYAEGPPAVEAGQHTILLAEALENAKAEATVTPDPAASADTNNPFLSGPVLTVLDFLSQGSNWMAVAYGTMNDKATKFGGGVALAYKISDFVAPTLRLDYYDGRVWMPSASLQLQVPLKLLGKLTVIPFAISGIATPIAGKGSSDGSAVGIFGAGLAVQLGSHFDLIGDAEKWTGYAGYQFRFGGLYKF